MLPQVIQTFNLKMPAQFPAALYDAIYDRVFRKYQGDRASGKVAEDFVMQQFLRSWAAVAYRFRASFEHSNEYIKVIEPYRYTLTAIDTETQYAQERELFNFFVSSLSTIESLFYSLYFVGAFADPTIFIYNPLNPKMLKDIKPVLTSRKFEAYERKVGTPEAKTLSQELTVLLSASQDTEMKGIRNPLAHSIVPIRTNWVHVVESVYKGASSSSSGTKWLNDIPLDLDTIATRHSWLAQKLEAIIRATDMFTLSRF